MLLLVCIQLSTEVSNLEEETRTLAEEIALLRLDLNELAERVPDSTGTDSPVTTDGA